jgi:hypothetical protein
MQYEIHQLLFCDPSSTKQNHALINPEKIITSTPNRVQSTPQRSDTEEQEEQDEQERLTVVLPAPR